MYTQKCDQIIIYISTNNWVKLAEDDSSVCLYALSSLIHINLSLSLSLSLGILSLSLRVDELGRRNGGGC